MINGRVQIDISYFGEHKVLFEFVLEWGGAKTGSCRFDLI